MLAKNRPSHVTLVSKDTKINYTISFEKHAYLQKFIDICLYLHTFPFWTGQKTGERGETEILKMGHKGKKGGSRSWRIKKEDKE